MLKVQKTIQHIFLISREFAKVCSILSNHGNYSFEEIVIVLVIWQLEYNVVGNHNW